MKTFAVMLENKVINVIVANSKEDAELVSNSICIEYTDENPAGIGWTHDGTTFEQPVITPTEEI